MHFREITHIEPPHWEPLPEPACRVCNGAGEVETEWDGEVVLDPCPHCTPRAANTDVEPAAPINREDLSDEDLPF